MKTMLPALLIAAILIGGAISLAGRSAQDPREGNNVRFSDGTQIIEIDAKGGYFPRQTAAKAGVPTILRVTTQGTFDCSSSLVISEIGYQGNLPPSGTMDITVPPQQPGAVLQGLCSMGMYSFQVRFQ